MDYEGFDFKHPEYAPVFTQRMRFLQEIRGNPACIPALKDWYREHPADFINDWGVTFDPRNADIGLPTIIPFILFPKQREWIDWLIERWRSRRPGATSKSRDMGISWLAMSLSCTLCLFYEGVAIGCGSRKSDLVDEIGAYKALLPKARMFMEYLPEEFRGGWQSWRDAPQMRLNFPETGSIITGEAGDQIGRGDRASIYFVDEAEFLERPVKVEHALSQTTNCRIDLSSVNGSANPVARRILSRKTDTFIFDWRDDPRKDDAWYAKMQEDHDPITVAQEIDRDRAASVSGIVIPGAWVRSAIGAMEKLGLGVSGAKGLSLDVADEGLDNNATAASHGVEITHLSEWSGKGADIFATTEEAFRQCDELGFDEFDYDADGLGAGVRGDARVINERRRANGQRQLSVIAYRGSEGVLEPEGIVEGTIGASAGDRGRTNLDYFANRKAQNWWSARRRFQKVHRWVTSKAEGKIVPATPDEIISLRADIPLLQKAVDELSQATFSVNGAGKIVINKKPNGMPSPNLADGIIQRMAKKQTAALPITSDLLQRLRGGRRRS